MHRIRETTGRRFPAVSLALCIALAGCAAAGASKAKAPTVPAGKAVEGTAGETYPWSVPLATAPLDDDPLTSPRTLWYREGKFGMFIHWGV